MQDHHYIPIKGSRMTSYVFQVSLEPDGDGWRAFYAPLEHIGASTWGNTQEEAIKHIHEVLSLIVDELLEEEKDIPAVEGLAVTSGAAVAITRWRH
jgi:predicted RNase H-like HicB family nuclease